MNSRRADWLDNFCTADVNCTTIWLTGFFAESDIWGR